MQYQLVNDATLTGLQPVMREAMVAGSRARTACGKSSLIITCGTNGNHSCGSLHPYGYALDLRTRDIPADRIDEFYLVLRQELAGKGFEVIHHATHCHIEWDKALHVVKDFALWDPK